MRKLGIMVVLFAIFLSGCSMRQEAGPCQITVSIKEVPDGLDRIKEGLDESCKVTVDIENLKTEKEISVELSEKNNYKAKVSVYPGTYKVDYVDASGNLYDVSCDEENSEFVLEEGDKAYKLKVKAQLSDTAENILKASKKEKALKYTAFERKVQIGKKVYDLDELFSADSSALDELQVNANNTDVAAFSKETVKSDGISVTVMNNSNETCLASSCEIISATISSTDFVLGGGIFVGQAVSSLTEGTDPILGIPDNIKGGLLKDTSKLVYLDDESGDKITISTSSNSYLSIKSIEYEFEVYE